MADNVVANAGSGGSTFATDDIGGVHYPRSKVVWGPDGTANDADVATGKLLPIQLRSSTGIEVIKIDDAAFTPATDSVIMIGCTFDDVAPDSVNEGDAGALRMSANRNLYVSIRDSAGNERGLNIDASGNLTANITGTVTVGSHAVTNAGTFAVQVDGNALTSLQLIDDVIKTDDAAFTPATDKVAMVGGQFDDTLPDSVDEGDAGALRMSGRRELYVQLRDSAGNERGLKVDANGAIAVTGGGGGTQYAEDAVHVSGDTGTLALVVRKDTATQLAGTDGDYTALVTDSSGRLHVNAGTVASHDVTNAGTFAVQVSSALPAGTNAIGKLTANSGVDIGDVDVTSLVPGTGATNLGKAEDAAHTTGDVGVMALSVRQDTAAALGGTDADYQPLITDASGRLHVNVGNTVTVGSHAVTNAGTFATQVDGAALTALQLIDDVVFADDAAFTPGSSKVAAIGCQADETSTDSVDEGDVGCPRMTLDRKQIVTDLPHTAGGLSASKTISAASTNSTNVKGSAGQLYEIIVSSINAAARYLKLYDKATAPTVGTDTPVWTILIPGNTAGAGIAKTIPKGLAFTLGIGFGLTTGVADNDTGAVAASEIVVNLGYK